MSVVVCRLPLSFPRLRTFPHRKGELVYRFFALVWLVAALISQLRNYLKIFGAGFASVTRLLGWLTI